MNTDVIAVDRETITNISRLDNAQKSAQDLAQDPILALDGISLSFGGVKALSDVSLEVADGEICAIIGPNGAGKSTLLNVVNGVYRPDRGSLTFCGTSRQYHRAHAAAVLGIGRTFQNIGLFKGMSVLENVLTGRNLMFRSTLIEHAFRLRRARSEERKNCERALNVIDFLQLSDHRNSAVGSLPTDCRSVSNSPARSLASLNYCCSTSRWPE